MKQGWEIKQWKDVLDIRSGRNQTEVENPNGKYPILGSAGKIMGFSDNFICDEGTTIVGRKGTINNPLFIESKFWNVDTAFGLHALDGLNKRFLFYFCRSYDFTKQDKGSGRPSLVKSDLQLIKMPIPPLQEQQRIVTILDEVFSAIERCRNNAEQNLKNSKELFENYLQKVYETKAKDWEQKKLGEVYDVRDGTHDSPKYQEEGFPLITSKNLKKDLLNYNNVNYISEQDYININKRSKVDKGDILLAMIGTIGNPVVIIDEPDFAIKNVALFKVPKEQNSYFLKYFLDSKSTINKMMGDAKGTTQKFVGLGYLRSFNINLPSLKQQQIIVQKLDALSLETKKLEAIYQQKINDLEELKKSILQKAFAGELKTKEVVL